MFLAHSQMVTCQCRICPNLLVSGFRVISVSWLTTPNIYPPMWFSVWERECCAFGSWGHHPFGIESWIGKELCSCSSNTFSFSGSQITLIWMSCLHSLEMFVISSSFEMRLFDTCMGHNSEEERKNDLVVVEADGGVSSLLYILVVTWGEGNWWWFLPVTLNRELPHRPVK